MQVKSVAAAIPLYNGAPFIREALESVISQTVPADEIIVVNDGSTDDGPRIVEEVAAENPAAPIVLLHKENGGQSSARNLAVRTCRSSHVAFLDQDDIWYEDHLELLRGPLEVGSRRNLAVVYGNLDQIDQRGRMVTCSLLDTLPTRHPKSSIAECLAADMFILPGASLVSVEAFNKLGGFDERLSGYEDDDLFLRMFSAGFASCYIKEAVTRWRIYPTSTSYSPRMTASRMIYFRKLAENYPDDPGMTQFWVRDLGAPRFFGQACLEFIKASRSGDKDAALRAWANVVETSTGLDARRRNRIRRVARLVEVLCRKSSLGLDRRLLRAAMR